MLELRDLFTEMVRREASDLHLVVGAPPQLRVRGELQSIDGAEPMTHESTRELVFGILTNEQRQKLETTWEIDFSYAVPGLARWRVNTFYQRGALGAAFRIIPEKIKPLNQLGVPDVLYRLCDLPRGLVLVTGPTGSGKSTTLASMIDIINEQRCEHILTVEDPIEFIHDHKNCVINQREVGADTDGFARALKSALRQDPDVILVGEMRDLETIQTALTAAETGHLVFGTLHTNGAAKTVDRIIDVFPPHQQAQIRVQLASSLQGVVTQTLVPTLDGKGRIVACEVMIPNPAIRNLIREGKVFQIPSVMQTSQEEGMQTLDAALSTLVRSNMIDKREALKRCSEETEFERLLASGSGAPPAGRLAYTPPANLRLRRRFNPLEDGAAAPVPMPQAPQGFDPAQLAGVAPGAPQMPAQVAAQPAQQAPVAQPVAPQPGVGFDAVPMPAQGVPAVPPPMEFRPVQPAAAQPGAPQQPHQLYAAAPAEPAAYAPAPQAAQPSVPMAQVQPDGTLAFPAAPPAPPQQPAMPASFAPPLPGQPPHAQGDVA